jgi:intermediate cleaving peptidase 55
VLHELRAVKSAGEIACMREAGRISGNAFNEVIRRGLRKEKDVEATLDWLFRMGGCEKSAYVPVVAGGKVFCFWGWG